MMQVLVKKNKFIVMKIRLKVAWSNITAIYYKNCIIFVSFGTIVTHHVSISTSNSLICSMREALRKGIETLKSICWSLSAVIILCNDS